MKPSKLRHPDANQNRERQGFVLGCFLANKPTSPGPFTLDSISGAADYVSHFGIQDMTSICVLKIAA